jgi:hypothetical protein
MTPADAKTVMRLPDLLQLDTLPSPVSLRPFSNGNPCLLRNLARKYPVVEHYICISYGPAPPHSPPLIKADKELRLGLAIVKGIGGLCDSSLYYIISRLARYVGRYASPPHMNMEVLQRFGGKTASLGLAVHAECCSFG